MVPSAQLRTFDRGVKKMPACPIAVLILRANKLDPHGLSGLGLHKKSHD